MLAGDVLLWLILGGAAALAWRNALRARENALAACRRLCKSYELQLLDQTVALASLRPVRSRRHGVSLRRVYGFEFTRDGERRETGNVTVEEGEVVAFYLPPGATERPT